MTTHDHLDTIDRAATTLADLGYDGLADELAEAGDTFRAALELSTPPTQEPSGWLPPDWSE